MGWAGLKQPLISQLGWALMKSKAQNNKNLGRAVARPSQLIDPPLRSRLTPKHLEMAVCLKDWFDVERRTQGKVILDEKFEQDEDDQ